jgi:hypothetical protein
MQHQASTACQGRFWCGFERCWACRDGPAAVPGRQHPHPSPGLSRPHTDCRLRRRRRVRGGRGRMSARGGDGRASRDFQRRRRFGPLLSSTGGMRVGRACRYPDSACGDRAEPRAGRRELTVAGAGRSRPAPMIHERGASLIRSVESRCGAATADVGSRWSPLLSRAPVPRSTSWFRFRTPRRRDSRTASSTAQCA